MQPLISCIMPTSPGRPHFSPSAIDSFIAQSHERRELIVVSEGDESDAGEPMARGAWIPRSVASDSRIRFVQCAAGLSIGEKRNLACEVAKGSVIAHWDDDDWSSERRLEAMLPGLGAGSVVGLRSMLFDDLRSNTVWRYSDVGPSVNLGTSLMYLRSYWHTHRFAHISAGEDLRFVRAAAASGHYRILDDREMGWGWLMVARTHEHNTVKRSYNSENWTPASRADLPRAYRNHPRGEAATA